MHLCQAAFSGDCCVNEASDTADIVYPQSSMEKSLVQYNHRPKKKWTDPLGLKSEANAEVP